MNSLQGSPASTPILSHAEVALKAKEYRRQYIEAWERFAGDANEANARALREVRSRVELFLRETEPHV